MVQNITAVPKCLKTDFLKLIRLDWPFIWVGIIFQRRLVDTEKAMSPISLVHGLMAYLSPLARTIALGIVITNWLYLSPVPFF